MKKLFSFILSCIIAVLPALLLSSCKSGEVYNESQDNLSIVSTIFPFYDFSKNIAGDKAQIKLLLSPGSEPHSYEPSPSDIVAIENCDIFIYNGGESDEWVENVISSISNKDIKIMKMMNYIEPLYEQNPDHSQGDEYDEHIWTSVKNSKMLCNAIYNEIVSIDEENKDYYSSNLSSYVQKLYRLDNTFSGIVKNGVRDTVVFGDRFPFLYFVTDYKLNYECAFPGCSSETEPGISTVTHLIDFVREEEIPVVFYLDFSNGKTAKLISEDTNAKPLLFSSCHNITKEQFENGEDYISIMENNANALKEALS